MKTYKTLALLAATAITALELLVFTRASAHVPPIETPRTAQTEAVISPSIDQTGDVRSVSGE